VLPRSIFALLLFASLRAQAPVSAQNVNAEDIVRRSVERDWTDYQSRQNYTYQQRTETRQYDRGGKLASTKSETSEVLILGGRPYERILAHNDRPLSERDARKEQEKLDREGAKRQHESAGELSRYNKERTEDRAFIREIPDAFTFKLEGTDTVSGQPAWVIQAEPKPGYHPQRSLAKNFLKVRAKIWIEQATYHWVKLDAEVLDTLSFGFGLVRIARGSTLHFEQIRVNDEIWLPSIILARADARLALVKKLRFEFDVRYSDYKKFRSDSRLLDTAE